VGRLFYRGAELDTFHPLDLEMDPRQVRAYDVRARWSASMLGTTFCGESVLPQQVAELPFAELALVA
jgi:hypothetical protein